MIKGLLSQASYSSDVSFQVFFLPPDEDVEIELVEEEPEFLKGHGRVGMDMSPMKIVKVRQQCAVVVATMKTHN